MAGIVLESIRFKRVYNESSLPKKALFGEPIYCKSNNSLYIGQGTDMPLKRLAGEINMDELPCKIEYTAKHKISFSNINDFTAIKENGKVKIIAEFNGTIELLTPYRVILRDVPQVCEAIDEGGVVKINAIMSNDSVVITSGHDILMNPNPLKTNITLFMDDVNLNEKFFFILFELDDMVYHKLDNKFIDTDTIATREFADNKFQTKTDVTLTTKSKNIPGAINEIDEKKIEAVRDSLNLPGTVDNEYPNLNTKSKKLIGAINEIDAQFNTNTQQIQEITKVLSNVDTTIIKDIPIEADSFNFSEKMQNQTVSVDYELEASTTNLNFTNLINNYGIQCVNGTKTDIDTTILETSGTPIDATKTLYYRYMISTLVANHVYYMATYAKSDNNLIKLQIGTSSDMYTITNDYVKYSNLKVYTSGSLYIGFSGIYNENNMVYMKKPLLIDLTAMYGAGNEPTLEVFESIIGDKWALNEYTENTGSVYNFILNSYDNTNVLMSSLNTANAETSINIYVGGHVSINCDVFPRHVTLKNVEYPYKITIIEDGSEIPNEVVSLKKVINLKNVDRLLFVGDSYTEGMYYQKGKAWVCQLSQQLDYNCDGFGFGGNTCAQLAERIKNNESRYNSIGVRDLNATRAMLMSFVNDMSTGGTNSSVFQAGMESLIKEVKNMGTQPIICTEFRNPWGTGLQIGLKALAQKYECEFWNILPITTFLGITTASDNSAFNWCFNGSHPAQRTGGIIFNNYLKFAKNLPRPTSAIKIYRLRDGITPTSNSDLMFNNRHDKLLKFKEILISHSCLSNETDYDKLNAMAGTAVNPVYSEYGKLINKENVNFGDYALVEVVLPTLRGNLKSLKLVLSDSTVESYVKTTNGFIATNLGVVSNLDCLEYDKVTFLLYKLGGFTLNDIYVEWEGNEVEKQHTVIRDITPNGSELLTTNVLTDMSKFTVTGTLIPEDATNYTVLPSGCTKIVKVSDVNYFSFAVTKPTTILGTVSKCRIRVIARYNPAISDTSITENSYDRKQLEIRIKGQNMVSIPTSYYSITNEIDMAWTLCEFDVELNENTDICIKSADSSELEVCYVSAIRLD